jgi:ribosomal protein L7/L12
MQLFGGKSQSSVFTIAGWRNLWPKDELAATDEELASLNDAGDENMAEIMRSARRLHFDVEPADVDEMLAEDALDLTVFELQELAKMASEKTSTSTPAAVAGQPTTAGKQEEGPYKSMPTRNIRRKVDTWAEAKEFAITGCPENKDEIEHLMLMVEGMFMHEARDELKRREKQTTIDRFSSFVLTFHFVSFIFGVC